MRHATVWAAALLVATSSVWAADQPSLDELLDLTPPAESPAEPDAQPDAAPGDPADAQTPDADDLTDLTAQQAADAFAQAVVEMDQTARRLGRDTDPGLETQRMQEEIMRKLDQVIAAAKQQKSKSKGGGGSSGSPRDQDQGSQQQASQSSQQQAGSQTSKGQQQAAGDENSGEFSPGSVGAQDASAGGMQETGREWGNLPARLRDELTEGMTEQFSPVYRLLTEAYYRRLAESGGE